MERFGDGTGNEGESLAALALSWQHLSPGLPITTPTAMALCQHRCQQLQTNTLIVDHTLEDSH